VDDIVCAQSMAGPDVEIEYWTRRMLTLISITEQLKSKGHRIVTGVLKAYVLSISFALWTHVLTYRY